MVGVAMGDRFLQLGCGDGRLFATLAGKVGLTGRACGIVPDATSAGIVQAAAAKQGILVEIEVAPYEALPYDDGTFDIALLYHVIAGMTPEQRVGCLQDVQRALRPGGRCMVIEVSPRGGLGGLLSRRRAHESYVATGGAERALTEEGYSAVRQLADREGEAFFEALKRRTP
jgi:ubiquinone/menaquinone biosynthesis C-methylase UbiE